MTMHSASPALPYATLARIAAARRLFDDLLNRLIRHRMKRALHAISDHLLADIGITRSGIDAAVDEFVPRHPSGR